MSRIGKQPIPLPPNTSVSIEEQQIKVDGPKGSLVVLSFVGLTVQQRESMLLVESKDSAQEAKLGLLRTLLQNAVTGVTVGWKKELELQGVGMRAALSGNNLVLNLGYSHPISFPVPEDIQLQVNKNTITVFGIDKYLVGETAAKLRSLRKPEPYKGKGIRYSNEAVRRKAGKTGKAK